MPKTGLFVRKNVKLFGIKLNPIDWKNSYIKFVQITNNNLVNITYNMLSCSGENDLFFLRGDNIVTIVHKNVIKLNANDFNNIILMHGGLSCIELKKLDEQSILYKEHIEKISQGEVLWQYKDNFSFIKRTVISFDESGVYIASGVVNEPPKWEDSSLMHRVPLNIRRKYINGITVEEYLVNKNEKEKIEIIENLIKYIFDTYATGDNKISGELCDCHTCNFIIDAEKHFHLIDFDYIYEKPIDKSYCIYRMLYHDKKLYYLMLNKFGLEDNSKYYNKFFNINLHQKLCSKYNVVTPEYLELYDKYFGSIKYCV